MPYVIKVSHDCHAGKPGEAVWGRWRASGHTCEARGRCFPLRLHWVRTEGTSQGDRHRRHGVGRHRQHNGHAAWRAFRRERSGCDQPHHFRALLSWRFRHFQEGFDVKGKKSAAAVWITGAIGLPVAMSFRWLGVTGWLGHGHCDGYCRPPTRCARRSRRRLIPMIAPKNKFSARSLWAVSIGRSSHRMRDLEQSPARC